MLNGFIKIAAVTPCIRVADTAFNSQNIADAMLECAAKGVKICVFPELCITGYTCSDLFYQDTLLGSAEIELDKLRELTQSFDMLCVVGLPLSVRGCLYNCAAVLYGGEILGVVPKSHLPNYGEFYEKRHFTTGLGLPNIFVNICGEEVPFGTNLLFCHEYISSLVMAVELCEDLWVPLPPSGYHSSAGATVIANCSASDELVCKDEYRRQLVSSHSGRLVCAYIYADAGAGESTQDLVYTGHNIIAENGAILAESESDSGIIMTEIDVSRLAFDRRKMGYFDGAGEGYEHIFWGAMPEKTELTRKFAKNPFVPDDAEKRRQRCEKILNLQSLGIKKRIEHTGAKSLVIGVSGGLDSTLALLVCARALDMLGRPRADIVAVTMPGFGTTARTRSNADLLAEKLGATLRVVSIDKAVRQHFADIAHDENIHNVVYENSQARERTQVLMDMANATNGLVVGTGDLSELALGWATYNGDHMSMYGVNGGVPKTLVRYLVAYYADSCGDDELADCLRDVLATPVSPELLPAENGEISQKTEDLVGPYELHDFYLYWLVRWGFEPQKIQQMANYVFEGEYDEETINKWLKTFVRRFFAQQFKRSCLPDGPKVGTITLSPRGDLRMPPDAVAKLWLEQL